MTIIKTYPIQGGSIPNGYQGIPYNDGNGNPVILTMVAGWVPPLKTAEITTPSIGLTISITPDGNGAIIGGTPNVSGQQALSVKCVDSAGEVMTGNF